MSRPHSFLRWLQPWWHRPPGTARPARSGRPRRPRCRPVLEQLEDRLTPAAPTAVYVNPAFTGPAGSDPDGAGPATAIGTDAFATIQPAIDAVADHGTVHVAPGTYSGGLTLAKSVVLRGSGSTSTFVDGTGTGTGLTITGDGADVSGLAVRGFDTGLRASGSTF